VNRSLQTILLRDNPWLVQSEQLSAWLRRRVPDRFIPRDVSSMVGERWAEANRAHLVIGPRQAGKSSLLWAHLAGRGEPVLFVDCEQALVQEWCRSAPLFLADLEDLLPRPVPLFFEEVQHLEEAGLFLKGLVDRRVAVPLLVTGSSSYHLGARTRESLAGRATRTRLLPLSFGEACQDLEGKPPLVAEQLRAERLDRHLTFGGYPAVWLSERPDLLLADQVEAVILRDASDLFRIGRPDAFRKLLSLLATQVGSPVNLSEWAAILGISRDTVASYLEILESGHVAVTLPPFAGGRRAELTSRPKIYLVDTGIRNRLVHDFNPPGERADAGPLLENWVFTELWKGLPDGATLHYWRSASGAEVDFVVARGAVTVAVEVKVGRGRRPLFPRAAHSFVEAYRPRALLMVQAEVAHRQRHGETEVRWLSPQEVAAAVRQYLPDPRPE
jgi:predicted AAA+ superfamily ATPase